MLFRSILHMQGQFPTEKKSFQQETYPSNSTGPKTQSGRLKHQPYNDFDKIIFDSYQNRESDDSDFSLSGTSPTRLEKSQKKFQFEKPLITLSKTYLGQKVFYYDNKRTDNLVYYRFRIVDSNKVLPALHSPFPRDCILGYLNFDKFRPLYVVNGYPYSYEGIPCKTLHGKLLFRRNRKGRMSLMSARHTITRDRFHNLVNSVNQKIYDIFLKFKKDYYSNLNDNIRKFLLKRHQFTRNGRLQSFSALEKTVFKNLKSVYPEVLDLLSTKKEILRKVNQVRKTPKLFLDGRFRREFDSLLSILKINFKGSWLTSFNQLDIENFDILEKNSIGKFYRPIIPPNSRRSGTRRKFPMDEIGEKTQFQGVLATPEHMEGHLAAAERRMKLNLEDLLSGKVKLYLPKGWINVFNLLGNQDALNIFKRDLPRVMLGLFPSSEVKSGLVVGYNYWSNLDQKSYAFWLDCIKISRLLMVRLPYPTILVNEQKYYSTGYCVFSIDGNMVHGGVPSGDLDTVDLKPFFRLSNPNRFFRFGRTARDKIPRIVEVALFYYHDVHDYNPRYEIEESFQSIQPNSEKGMEKEDS